MLFFLIYGGCGRAIAVYGQPRSLSSIEKNIKKATADTQKVKLALLSAEELKQKGNIQKSFKLLQNIKPAVDSLDNSGLSLKFEIQLADNYLSNQQPDSAEHVLTGLLNRYPGSAHKAEMKSLLGNAYRYQGKYKEALDEQEQAKSLIDSVQNPRIFSRINLNMGSIHGDIGNFGLAFKYFLRSIEGAKAVGDSLLLATSYNNLGNTYNQHSEPEEGRYYLVLAQQIYGEIDNKVGLLRVYNNLAISFQKLHQFDKAVEIYHKALNLHKRIRKNVPPFQLLYNLGQVYKDKGSLEKATTYYKQSLAYCKKAEISQGLIYNYGGLANVAELRDSLSQAHDYYAQALQVASNIGAMHLKSMVSKNLYRLEKSRKRYKQALKYHEKYVALNDSLIKQANAQDIKKSKTKLNLHKQQQINKLLRRQHEQQKARLKAENWFIIIGVCVLILVLILTYSLYKANKKKNKVNSILKGHRGELGELNRVKDKILAVISHDLRSPMASMQGMIYLLREEELSEEEFDDMAAQLEMSISQNVSMMENLLVWSRQQMTGLDFDIKDTDIHKICDEVLENSHGQAEHKGVQLINEIKPSTHVMADATLLRIVIRNLISNSIKFCKTEDKVMVRAYPKDGHTVCEVEDTGIGISETNKANLFSMTGNSHKGTNSEKGTGLGLHLCKTFIEAQGGEIWFKSKENKGTTFAFTLETAAINPTASALLDDGFEINGGQARS